jgi:hypothetical protein
MFFQINSKRRKTPNLTRSTVLDHNFLVGKVVAQSVVYFWGKDGTKQNIKKRIVRSKGSTGENAQRIGRTQKCYKKNKRKLTTSQVSFILLHLSSEQSFPFVIRLIYFLNFYVFVLSKSAVFMCPMQRALEDMSYLMLFLVLANFETLIYLQILLHNLFPTNSQTLMKALAKNPSSLPYLIQLIQRSVALGIQNGR